MSTNEVSSQDLGGAAPSVGGFDTGTFVPSYASWWRRAASYSLYILLVSCIQIAIGLVIGSRIPSEIVGLAVFFGLDAPSLARRGAWYDMRFTAIALVDAETLKPISYGRVALRYLATLLNILPLGIGFLAPIWTSRKQTFADMACKTVVVNANPDSTPASAPRRKALVWIVNILALFIVPLCLTAAYVMPTFASVQQNAADSVASREAEMVWRQAAAEAAFGGGPITNKDIEEASTVVGSGTYSPADSSYKVTFEDQEATVYICTEGISETPCV